MDRTIDRTIDRTKDRTKDRTRSKRTEGKSTEHRAQNPEHGAQMLMLRWVGGPGGGLPRDLRSLAT
jgi:hypothetical protein